MPIKKRFQFRCKKCNKLSSSTNKLIVKYSVCYACRIPVFKKTYDAKY